VLISYAHLIAQLAENGLVGALVPQQQRHVPNVGHVVDVEAVVVRHVAELGQLRKLVLCSRGCGQRTGTLWSRLSFQLDSLRRMLAMSWKLRQRAEAEVGQLRLGAVLRGLWSRKRVVVNLKRWKNLGK
jgi:hypothetical protein